MESIFAQNVKIQQALTKSEQEFRLVFELAPIGMMITNLDGEILQVNQSFCELIQKIPSQLINTSDTAIIHPDSVKTFLDFKRKIITESLEFDREEISLLSSNGSLVYTIFNVTVLRNSKGEIKQFIQQIIDVSELKIQGEEIFYNTFYDRLTGLPNRFLLIDRITQYCRIHKSDSCYSILFIDIDNFKKINDSWGRSTGDELLVLISEKITGCIGSKDVLARVSGDEFIVFVPDVESIAEGVDIAQKIMMSCRINTTLNNDKTVICSVSIGLALGKGKKRKPEMVIRDADLAMYFAKEKGKNSYQVFQPSMRSGLVKKINLESSLSQAIENNELEVHYQAIMDLETNQIAGFEALIRWYNSIHGFVSPVDFIPIAEETGLIVPIGTWILYSCASQIKKWQAKYPHLELFVAVNVSSRQLMHPHFLNTIDAVLSQTNVDPNLLKIEITESILMEKYQYAQEVLLQLKQRQLKISLDDFGTGYSSLSYLHNLPFDTLKIDRSFIQSLTYLEQPTPIVEAIVQLANSLSLDVVAEGIETPIQEQILQKMRCKYGQGYFYTKPLPALAVEEFVDSVNSQQSEV